MSLLQNMWHNPTVSTLSQPRDALASIQRRPHNFVTRLRREPMPGVCPYYDVTMGCYLPTSSSWPKPSRCPSSWATSVAVWSALPMRRAVIWLSLVQSLPLVVAAERPWSAIGSLPRLQKAYDMMTSSNGSIFHVTCHLCGEFTDHRWILRTKASDAELWCVLRSALEWKVM